MCGAPVREGRVTVVITAPIRRAVWACVDPVLRQSALLDVSPRPTKGWPHEPLGPRAFREVYYPSGGPGGYLSPISPRSLGWFWNNRPKDPRSSFVFDFTKKCLENKPAGSLLLNSEWFGKNDLLLSSSTITPRNLVFCLRFMLQRSAFCTVELWCSLGAPKVHPMGVAPELRVDFCR
jgi:hypothetical protein